MKKIYSVFILICMLVSMLVLTSCSKELNDESYAGGDLVGGVPNRGEAFMPELDSDHDGSDGVKDSETEDGETEDGDEPDDSAENVVLPSGMMTAAAWNDNTYYNDWLALFSQDEQATGKFYNFTNPDYSWGYNSRDRVDVYVTSGGNAVAGASVSAHDSQGNKVFSAVTDATGKAYLFPSLDEGSITVACGSESVSEGFNREHRSVSVDLAEQGNKLNVIEIMLVVDVTGSMSDEIDFLKAELADVINRIAANDSETVIKLAMLFYRDTDDKVPFDYYDFTDVTTPHGLSKQQSALNKQNASGGGDYPEAVDDALDMAVNKQWSTGATTKIIYHVLDAPAHNNTDNKEKLENAVKNAAEKGIRICPIICSGASTDTEYTMREAAIYTGGTFIFVTDDSGIGGSHHDPDLPNATVELLNSLMVRLTKGYHTGEFDEPVYWKQDSNLGAKK